MAAGWRLLSLLLLHLSTPFSSANGAQVSDAFWQGRGICRARECRRAAGADTLLLAAGGTLTLVALSPPHSGG
jgi:hypothetical protein